MASRRARKSPCDRRRPHAEIRPPRRRRRRAAREGHARPRERRDSRLHARRHRGHGQGGPVERRGDGGGRDRPREHLPPDAPAGRGADPLSRRPAPVRRLAAADPDRLRRFPGDVPGREQEALGGGSPLPEPPRRQPAPPDAREGGPAAARRFRRRRRDGARRVHAVPGDARPGGALDGAHPPLGARGAARRSSPSAATAGAARSSGSSRGGCSPT